MRETLLWCVCILLVLTLILWPVVVASEKQPDHAAKICATGADFPWYWPCEQLHDIEGVPKSVLEKDV